MFRIIFFLIASVAIALVSGQLNNEQSNTTTTVQPTNTTTEVTTKVTNGTTETTTPSTNVTTFAPTTTVSPTLPPKQDPEEWNGTVSKNNVTCIRVQFKVQISVKYTNATNHTETTYFNIPTNAKVDEDNSYCSSNQTQLEAIVIDFVDSYTSGNLKLVFNKTGNEVFVQEVELSYNLTKEQFPGYLHPSEYNKMVKVSKTLGTDSKLFRVASQRSYTCSSTQTADLAQKDEKLPAKIDFTSSQVEAYIDPKQAGKFDTAIDCVTTNVSDVVPIAVGAALAGLVIIVLIAYFIGRRRSRRLAYQSV